MVANSRAISKAVKELSRKADASEILSIQQHFQSSLEGEIRQVGSSSFGCVKWLYISFNHHFQIRDGSVGRYEMDR